GALTGHVFVPAAGQGVIAVQAREGSAAADVAVTVGHARTLACLRAERTAVRELNASCHTSVGIHASGVTIRGFAGLPDGSEWLVDETALGGGGERAEGAGGEGAEGGGDESAVGRGDDLEAAGLALARRMLAAGAADLLREAEAMAAR
ncbi:MAG TPA: hypothetical protein VNO82_19365, partial [Solirubrobacteraceae bacterium]|nr:hypothetical protein [Solirubrobacteraceae bacterium]